MGLNCSYWSALHSEQIQSWLNWHQSSLAKSQLSTGCFLVPGATELSYQHLPFPVPTSGTLRTFNPLLAPSGSYHWPESVSTPFLLISPVYKHFTVTASNYLLLQLHGYHTCTSHKKQMSS